MKEQHELGVRTSVRKTDKVNEKYILVYEGSQTEPIYFKTLIDQRNRVGISKLIDIIPIERKFNEKTWSNPKKILELILSRIDETDKNKISYRTLVNAIFCTIYNDEYLKTENDYDSKYNALINSVIKNKLRKTESDIVDDLENTVKNLISEIGSCWPDIFNITMEKLCNSIDKLKILYDPDIDKVCLIVDRDPKSFTQKQYDFVEKSCIEKNMTFCITNPCFEFWLLLHFDDVLSLDKKDLLENKKISKKRTYISSILSEKLNGYKKSKYDALKLIENVDKAISNEKNFTEDIQQLKTELGSNIGLLISEMRSSD